MRKILTFIVLLFLNQLCYAQSNQDIIVEYQKQLSELNDKKTDIEHKIEDVKLTDIRAQMKTVGLPSAEYIEHIAFFTEYAEEHEQAKWVMHMITTDVVNLGSARTNDFRVDPLVTTGTAVELDYFIKSTDDSGKDVYDGFGYDRGHLAPSADFRWSSRALSESYFYSNMSPQVGDFNRKIWAELESYLRGYVISNNSNLIVITGPVLDDSLSKIPRSVNGVSIPNQFYKIAYDPLNGQAIAFLMNNEGSTKEISSFATSVDEIERITGFDFYPNIDESIESKVNTEHWFKVENSEKNVDPIPFNKLNPGQWNTVSGGQKTKSKKDAIVCGTVVSSRNSRKGHAWLFLDKAYPNEYFSVMIKKQYLHNFTYDPIVELVDQKVCFEGKVFELGNDSERPTMSIETPNKIRNFVPK